MRRVAASCLPVTFLALIDHLRAMGIGTALAMPCSFQARSSGRALGARLGLAGAHEWYPGFRGPLGRARFGSSPVDERAWGSALQMHRLRTRARFARDRSPVDRSSRVTPP